MCIFSNFREKNAPLLLGSSWFHVISMYICVHTHKFQLKLCKIMAMCKWGDCEIRVINNKYACPIWKDLEKLIFQNHNRGIILFDSHFLVYEWIKAIKMPSLKRKRKKRRKNITHAYIICRGKLFSLSQVLTPTLCKYEEWNKKNRDELR